MNHPLSDLIDGNHAWAERVERERPGFFQSLTQQQHPRYMWIGCADSRVPANEVVNLAPGELFVHRNVANVVVHSDLNCLSVLQYAVDNLHVEHVLVVGHYGCGGVRAALESQRVGLVDNWLRHVQDVRNRHSQWLATLTDIQQRADALCELNALEQAVNVAQTTVVQDAWARNQTLAIHGWVYSLRNGLVNDLQITIESPDDIEPAYEQALERIKTRAHHTGGR